MFEELSEVSYKVNPRFLDPRLCLIADNSDPIDMRGKANTVCANSPALTLAETTIRRQKR
jgi:hypothetical protein